MELRTVLSGQLNIDRMQALAVMNLQNKEENLIRKDDPTQFFRWNSRA